MNNTTTPTIGKHTLESLTVGMYSDPFTIYREYIQNSCDAIDIAIEQNVLDLKDARIEVNVYDTERIIRIKDNGIGIKASNAFSTLCDIGNSYKDHRYARGFRGIGRLGGLGYASRIVFKTSYIGENVESEVSWDAEKLKQFLRPSANREMDLVKVISAVTSINNSEVKPEDHYFIVELYGVDENFPELIDEIEVGNYLSMVAPVPFDCQKFIYGKSIKQYFLSQNVDIDEYQIFLNDSPQAITKRYKTNYLTGKQERTSKRNDIHDVEYFMDSTSDGKLVYIGWLGISDFSGTVDDDFMRGVRVRKGNILIGDESTFNQFFTSEQHRANGVFIGEVHILSQDIIPNARRDDFESNEAFGYLKEKLTDYADGINKKYRRGYSQVNSALKKYEDGKRQLEEVEEEINTAGVTSEVHKEKLLNEKNKIEKQLSDAVTELEKAKTKIGDNNRRTSQIDSVLTEHKEKKKAIISLENKIVDSGYKGKDELSFLSREERKLYKKIIEVIDSSLPKEVASPLVAQIIAAIMPGRKNK